MIPQIAGMLREAGRESLVILCTPPPSTALFSVLMRQADRIIEIAAADDSAGTTLYTAVPVIASCRSILRSQRTLEVS